MPATAAFLPRPVGVTNPSSLPRPAPRCAAPVEVVAPEVPSWGKYKVSCWGCGSGGGGKKHELHASLNLGSPAPINTLPDAAARHMQLTQIVMLFNIQKPTQVATFEYKFPAILDSILTVGLKTELHARLW